MPAKKRKVQEVKSWDKPSVLTDNQVVASDLAMKLLPPYASIPKEFKDHYNEWVALTSRWFFSGLKGHFVPKPGIDLQAAMRHLNICMSSWVLKHEHKEAGCAYLMSLWFERFKEDR